MREYQYYEFQAIDSPLDDHQVGELRRLSTRARITPTSFVNDYQWGSLRGDPHRLMQRYFDVFLYVSTWGKHQLMLRLPQRLVDLETVRRYCVGDAATACTYNAHVIVTLTSEDDTGDWKGGYDDGQQRMASITPVRVEILSGDLRALYLSWLLCVQCGGVEPNAAEPPVPAGLRNLTAGLESLADFLRIDADLTAEAATASEELAEYSASSAASWVESLPAGERDALIVGVLRGDAHLRAELLRRYRHQVTETGEAGTGPRTAGELLDAAAARREMRVRVASEQRAHQRASHQNQATLTRETYLDRLALREGDTWQQVRNLIETAKPSSYNAAVRLILDLRAVCGRTGRTELFDQRVRELRVQHARKQSLLARLDRAGL